jgi:tRNA (guanine37-N1)-methyltransferase
LGKKNSLVYKIASKILDKENAKTVSRSIDIVGDIAILKMPDSLTDYKKKLGEELLREASYLNVVLRQISPVQGDFRVRNFEWIAGEERTTTYHKEYGCIYEIDLDKAYFSPRLSNERDIIANIVKEGEKVLNMFAGVGCFSILIAKRHMDVKIYSIDLNVEAFKLMVSNTLLNKVLNKVVPIFGDATAITEGLFKGKLDRVIMPLPEKALKFLGVAIKALKPEGGIIHFQGFVHADKGVNPLEIAVKNIEAYIHTLNVTIENKRVIREIGPFRYQIALDLTIE